MLMAITIFFTFAALERLGNGYAWPKEPYWVVRGVIWMFAVLSISHVLAGIVHELLYPYSVFDLTFLGLWAILPSFLVYQLLLYGYHRALHSVPFLWRIHQCHHSSERLDVWSTYRTHPLEVPGYVLISFAVSVGLLGLTSGAAFWTSLLILAIQSLEHTNIRTPIWLGYVIARPENHMLHHARGGHHANYSDLPVIDMLFGTFEVPEIAPPEVGFWDGASRRVGPMLRIEDISTPLDD